ncbi:hypothetical protein [Candidatus Thiodubiliella endoseptemdiera]|uniref:hypothetical protein n=1 Tax=Candidatus Thiodubiliella endoseptemdiera TaxID=2738886 RepID=UPI0034E02B62
MIKVACPHLFFIFPFIPPHLFPVDGYMDKAEDFERGVGEYIYDTKIMGTGYFL